MRSSLAAVLAMATSALAELVTFDFNVSWVMVNPDGEFDRKVIGINGKWPLPIIEVTTGDQVVVNMHNDLGDKSTSIHWHGMFQNGTTEMDGASMVTQCPVPPGSSITYNFTATQNGTYWYHCHTDYCYPDGYRQAFIIRDPEAPFTYDEELIFTLTDWYHDLVEDLADSFMSLYNPSGAEPIPDAFLVNDKLNASYPVKANTTYLMRILNTGAFVGQYFYIEGQNFTVVEVDGVYTEPQVADTLYLGIAQRYGILVTTPADMDDFWKIVTVADQDLLDSIPTTLQLNGTNWLVYNNDSSLEPANITVAVSDDLVPIDDMVLLPYDGEELLPEPDVIVNVTVYMVNLMTGYNYAMLDNITYTQPKVPTLYSALSAGSEVATNDVIYGEYTHPIVLGHNQVVQIVLNNGDSGSHPFHLHGHTFQVLDRWPALGPDFASLADASPIAYDPANHTAFPDKPIRRDTLVLPPNGYAVMRFRADNPGVWIFHCHIDWHLASGLAMTFIEAPELLATRISVPEDHYAACAAASVPTVGNAAANAKDFTDLSGQNKQPKTIPNGFTPRGEAAMAFSVLSALLGIVSIVIYGMADLKHRPIAEEPLGVVTETANKTSGSASGANGSEEVVTKSG
ncbi:ferrooxidoreductase [Grosmannia clavigera kw1407]|uniref:Ferrooxidoreductase n=1 Tax=Grosmannia clavigera (strain kw1407 / UAMH 11150) TaxID=655863 RepID=F0XLH3_GROCL|nr:ferrooxidoreductase [Grosmannia clavigera kw1407]EFX01412.1 ferrooxidoreductase [Grosmannia clavigera kw1407]